MQRALQLVQQVLKLAAEIQFVPLTYSILNAIGELLLKSSWPEYGLKVMAFVQQHTANDHATQAEERQVLDGHRNDAGKEEADHLNAVQAYAENRTLSDVVAEVGDWLQGQTTGMGTGHEEGSHNKRTGF